MEGYVIPKVRIFVKQLTSTVASSITLVQVSSVVITRAKEETTTHLLVSSENVNHAMLDLVCDVRQIHLVSTTRRAFTASTPSVHVLEQEKRKGKKNSHLESRSVVLVESLETLDEEERRREPDWSSPVTVPSKHATLGISRPVVHAELLAVDFHRPRVLLVVTREPMSRR